MILAEACRSQEYVGPLTAMPTLPGRKGCRPDAISVARLRWWSRAQLCQDLSWLTDELFFILATCHLLLHVIKLCSAIRKGECDGTTEPNLSNTKLARTAGADKYAPWRRCFPFWRHYIREKLNVVLNICPSSVCVFQQSKTLLIPVLFGTVFVW